MSGQVNPSAWGLIHDSARSLWADAAEILYGAHEWAQVSLGGATDDSAHEQGLFIASNAVRLAELAALIAATAPDTDPVVEAAGITALAMEALSSYWQRERSGEAAGHVSNLRRRMSAAWCEWERFERSRSEPRA